MFFPLTTCNCNFRPLHELETLWLKDNILIENSGISYQFNDPWNKTLSLLSVNLTHTGRYTCQVRLRTGGFPTVSASANVVVLGKFLKFYILYFRKALNISCIK